MGVGLVLLLGAVVAASVASRGPGPLDAPSEVSVELPLRSGQIATWGSVLPGNSTVSDITIDSVELVNVEGVEVLGVVLSDPDVDGGIGTAEGFPPQGANLRQANGAALKPAGGSPSHLQVLVGVRLSGAAEGSIEAIRVRYRHEGSEYELVLPYRLRVVGQP